MLLLDLNKVFDTVWHDELLLKLRNNNFPIHLLKIIHSFLTDWHFKVPVGYDLSSPRLITTGVPQGLVLGPVLLNLYINDIPNNPKTKLAIFADDTAIFWTSWSSLYLKKYLQDHLNSILKYFLDWKIGINPSKTEAIIFYRKNSAKFKIPPSIKILSTQIQWENQVKYLGLILDKSVNWKAAGHWRQKSQSPYPSQKFIPPPLQKKPASQQTWNTSLHLMCSSYHYIRSSTLGRAAKTNLQKLQSVQNTYLRIIFKKREERISTKKLHTKANILFIKEHIQKHINNSAESIQVHYNPLLKKLSLFRHKQTTI